MQKAAKNRKRGPGEKRTGRETITNQTGYIPLSMQLARLEAAGQQLSAYRAENYDFPPGVIVDDELQDPTRRPDYDMADASTALRDLERKLTERKRKEKEQKEYEESMKDTPEEIADKAAIDKEIKHDEG